MSSPRPCEALVAGLHLRWDGVWQRPHHLLSRFARRVPVVVVEEPFFAPEDRDEIRRDGAVTIVRPLRREPRRAFIDSSAIAAARALLGEKAPAVWLYQPMMLALADAFPAAPLVYDCMDDLAAFAFAPPEMSVRESTLLERAAAVFCGGRTLYERRRRYGEKVQLLPSGVEYERFAAAVSLPPHPLLEPLPPPRYGYVGVVDERLDPAILAALAGDAERPNVMIVGPVVKIDPAILPEATNLHFTGALPYAELPSILAGLEVALMPFALNESTRSISPTKTLEYLAAGVPVVSTPVADVVHDFGDVVTISDAAGFSRACAAARVRDQAARARGQAIARTRTWDALAARMWEALHRTPLRGEPRDSGAQ